MANILEAICNIVEKHDALLDTTFMGKNRANSMGASLENYIKDAFAGTINERDEQQRLKVHSSVFSWLGGQNNPPDMMIRGGDAIEVKKVEGAINAIALNSSYPKAILKASSSMITKKCKSCEDWREKDIIYCVGHAEKANLRSLWFVYGSVYAATEATYTRIANTIKEGIKTIPHVELSDTKELGRVNRVDPLGITHLRIRGMWGIDNPRRVYGHLHSFKGEKFDLVALIPLEKYATFPQQSILRIENAQNIVITDVVVPNPNNPATLIDCKCIIFIVS
jgi:hypothetical protein